MIMKKIFVLLSFLLSACTLPITYNDTHQQAKPNANLLPAMHTKVYTQNLKAAFSDITNDEEKPDKTTRDVIVDDAINIFEREVEQNITTGEGEKNGYIALRVQYVELQHSTGLRATSIATLGLLNMVGFPVDKHTQIMEAEVEIMNKKHGVIKRYTETVESSAFRALYWGYQRSDVNRKVSAENMKKFMQIISAKINSDASEIRQKLN